MTAAEPGPVGTAAVLPRARPSTAWAVLVTVGCVAGLLWTVVDRLAHAGLVAGALLIGLAVLAVYGALIGLVVRAMDRWRTLRRRTVLVALGWGGLVATALAISANSDLSTFLGSLLGVGTAADAVAPVIAPLVEETVKGLGVVAAVVAAGRRASGPLEAMLLGSLSGLGFQLVENVTYVYDGALRNANGDLIGMGGALLVRLPLGLDGHWVYSSFTGLAVGLLVTGACRTRARRVLGAVALVLASLGAHFLNNASSLIGPAATLLFAPALALASLAVAYRFAARTQWRQASAALAAEPDGISTDDERAALRTGRSARRYARASGGRDRRTRVTTQRAQMRLGTALLQGRPDEQLRDTVRRARAAVADPEPRP